MRFFRKTDKKGRKKRTAFFYAILCYVTCLSLSFGLLRTAQKTRQVLYGGTPVLASVTASESAQSPSAYHISLGGGEWELFLTEKSDKAAVELYTFLPPGMGKWLLRTYCFWNQTTELLLG